MCLDNLPGDDETRIGFMAVDSCIHYFQFTPDELHPRLLTIPDCDEPFVPSHSGILINLESYKEVWDSVINISPIYLFL